MLIILNDNNMPKEVRSQDNVSSWIDWLILVCFTPYQQYSSNVTAVVSG